MCTKYNKEQYPHQEHVHSCPSQCIRRLQAAAVYSEVGGSVEVKEPD